MGNAHASGNRHLTPADYEQWSRTYPASPRSWTIDDPYLQAHYFPQFKSPPRYEEKAHLRGELPHYRGFTSENQQQVPKVKVLPTNVNDQPKLRATDNGVALHEAGTIVNRKVTYQYDYHTRSVEQVEQSAGPAVTNAAEQADQLGPSKEAVRPRDPSMDRSKDSSSDAEARSSRSRSETRKPPRKLGLFKTKSNSKNRRDSTPKQYAGSMEYLKADISSETKELRGSCDDLGSIMLGSGPVTVFSSQCPKNDSDPWSDTETSKQKVVPQKDPEFQKEISEMVRKKESFLRKTKPVVADKQKQFYYGATEEDLAVTTGRPRSPSPKMKKPIRVARKESDFEEESRKVMEEFDSVFVERKPVTGHVSRYDKERGRGRSRRSPPPPAPPSPVTVSKKKEQRKVSKSVDELDSYDENINLHLRPILPKKSSQLPRFSPSAAWKALGLSSSEDSVRNKSLKDSSFSTSANSQQQLQSSRGSELSEDDDVFEFRIPRDARAMAPQRAANEKSADSGISGSPDASGVKPLAMSSPVTKHSGINWTPEQDLEESSNDDIRLESSRTTPTAKNGRNTPPKFTPKSQMFQPAPSENQSRNSSLSKGKGRRFRKKKDDTMNDSTESNTSAPYKYNSLRKLKRSVSGAFAAVALRSRSKSPDVRSVTDSNWLLSRSAPNSVFSGLEPTGMKYRSEADLSREPIGYVPLVRQFPAHSQPILSHRVIYLPQYDSKMRSSRIDVSARSDSSGPVLVSSHLAPKPRLQQRVRDFYFASRIKKAQSADAVYVEPKMMVTPAASMWELPPYLASTPRNPNHLGRSNIPTRRFTFQSTMRMQEQQAMAAKLAKEAEKKEKRRLKEIEVMRRVEEEFQRKRAGENANIREQLHLHRVTENKKPSGRQEPEGAAANVVPQGDRARVHSPSPAKSLERKAPAAYPEKHYHQSNAVTGRFAMTSQNNKDQSLPKLKDKSSPRIRTQELSEYREQRREYRDFQNPRQYPQIYRSSTPSGGLSQNSPRSPPSAPSVSDNYRWGFAHGVQGRYKPLNSRPAKPARNPNVGRDYRNFLSSSESNSDLLRPYHH